MNAVELSENDNALLQEVIKSGNSIIPVYQENLDNISGVLHTKDIVKLIIEGNSLNIKNLMRPAYFVPETKLISEILKEMQNRGDRLAIVTDEYGGTEGVITMEDIIEEIVGEFSDAGHTKEFNRLPDGKYYVLGSMYIDDFNEVFNINIPVSDEYSTVAGFVADKSGKILNVGEFLKFDRLTFELIKKTRQKMVQFRVYSDDGEFAETIRPN
jgi:CBS domain containing-hemolysin-like protein